MIDNLKKLLDVLETKQLAKIFRKYVKEQNIKKFDGRKKDNNNTYFVEGNDEGWDRVICMVTDYKDFTGIEIVLRKRAGRYLIVRYGARTVFEADFDGRNRKSYFDKLLFNEIYKNHKALFDELFRLI